MIPGEQVKAARDRLKESQAEFGQRFGVYQTTIHRWETKGVPTKGSAATLVSKVLDELEREPAQ